MQRGYYTGVRINELQPTCINMDEPQEHKNETAKLQKNTLGRIPFI